MPVGWFGTPFLVSIMYPYEFFLIVFLGQISIEGLTKFLMSSDNPILMPELINIHQDMTCPLPHYFVSSSHNTYLTGKFIYCQEYF